MLNPTGAFAGISVADLAAAKNFYTETLGLKILDESMGLSLALPGGGSVFLYPKADHQPATFTVLNFKVADIDAAADALASAGVTFERYPEMQQDAKGIARGRAANRGPDIAWFTDPSGNILSIVH